MYHRRFAALFLSDNAAFSLAREAGLRWITEQPDCPWAQHWWLLFEDGAEAVAAAISADTPQGRHLRTTHPAWLMPYPEPILELRRAEWRAAKLWLIERHRGSLRDAFERWQELVELTKADGRSVAEWLVAPGVALNISEQPPKEDDR